MKKYLSLALAGLLALSMTACGGIAADLAAMASPKSESEAAASGSSSAAQQEITIRSLNGSKETVDLTVPYDPQRIAVLDMASLDILDALGLGGRVVGSASMENTFCPALVAISTHRPLSWPLWIRLLSWSLKAVVRWGIPSSPGVVRG